MRLRLPIAAVSAAFVLLAPLAAHAAAPAAAKPAAAKAAAQPADPTASKHIARLVHGPSDHARAALAAGYAAAAKADAKLTRAAWVAALGKTSDDKSAYLHAAALWTGFGVAADSANAYTGMMAVSDKGYAPAQRDHALQMAATSSDAAKTNAYALMTKAAASDAAALTEQGIMRTEGTGVESDPKEGFAILTKAAEQGNTKATYYAGLLTKMGLGVDKDMVRSAGYLKQAAEAGDDRAMFAWGAMVENEGGGGEPDPKTGTEWITKAARAGNADAMAILALKYVRAIGVEKNENEALSWSRTGAEGGHADCQFMAAQLLMMMNSEDPKSISEAYRWAQAAADQGNENAAEMVKDLAVKNAYQGEKSDDKK